MSADHTPERLSAAEREALMDALSAPSHKREWFVIDAAQDILAAHLADVEARLTAVEAEHRVIHQAGAELVCFCGAHLSVYGLTRSLASVFAQHVRDARALHPAPRPASMFQAAGFDTDDPDLHPDPSEVARDE